MDFFETKEGNCTIVMSSEENFVVEQKYEDVIVRLQCFTKIDVNRC
jgi:uncharacterized protein YlzI (FlbEa/FlbD family)